MTNFVTFRHISNGALADYPADYIDHPVFGYDLELYVPEEYEEDKVIIAGHELPTEQRTQVYATTRYDDMHVDELKEELKSAGLSTSGNKAELIERLSADNTETNEVI